MFFQEMHMGIKLIEVIFRYGALVFGLGFLAPLIRELIILSGIAVPFGVSPLLVGVIFGGGLGVIAQIRGSWIWQK